MTSQWVLPDTFSPDYYLDLYPDVANSPHFGRDHGQAARHYEHWGIREGRSPNPFFYPDYYLDKYPDLVNAFGQDNFPRALRHWLEFGIDEGRRGSPIFDSKFYLSSHPDLINAFGSTNYRRAYLHWLEVGIAEGRRSIPEVDDPLFETTGFISEPKLATLAPYAGRHKAAIELFKSINKVIKQVSAGVTLYEVYSGVRDLLKDKAKNDDRLGEVKERLEKFDPHRDPTVPADGSIDLPGRDPDRPVA